MKKLIKIKPKIVVILGPTSSGKSSLAITMAKKFNGEIISADSRQVYKGMNIGTGKVTKKEMGGIPHYLLDVVSPNTIFDIMKWKRKTDKAMKDILKRNKLPIICGGTGLYIKALVENISYPNIKPDWKLRIRLEKKSTEELFNMLKKLDSDRAKSIDSKNPRRLIRALEIVMQSGEKVPKNKSTLRYDSLLIGIQRPKQELEVLIKKRLHERFLQGMIPEVNNLHKKGVSWKRMKEIGLEYKYISLFLQGKLTKKEMIEMLNIKIRQYSKRQRTWFNKTPSVYWIRTQKEAEKLIKLFLDPILK